MRRLVFIESSTLLDTWSMAKELVGAIARDCGTDRSGALRELDAESARGADPTAVHRALWNLVAGHRPRRPAGCIDRTDPLGRTAARVLRCHRRAGNTVVVVSDLIPVFGPLLTEHLQVDRVVCGTPGGGGDPADGILLGAAAAQAAERVARAGSVAPADCVAYGRFPRDRDLLDAVGHAVRIDYEGRLHPQPRRLAGMPALAGEDREHPAAHPGTGAVGGCLAAGGGAVTLRRRPQQGPRAGAPTSKVPAATSAMVASCEPENPGSPNRSAAVSPASPRKNCGINRPEVDTSLPKVGDLPRSAASPATSGTGSMPAAVLTTNTLVHRSSMSRWASSTDPGRCSFSGSWSGIALITSSRPGPTSVR